MLDYESFKSVLIKRIKEFLPEKYQDWKVTVNRTPKVNGFKESIDIIPVSGDFAAVPRLYVEDLYLFYQDCKSMEYLLKKAGEFFVKGMEYAQSIVSEKEPEKLEDSIIMALVNSVENRELQASVPNRSLLDLTIIYRIMVKLSDGSFNSAIITNAHAEILDLTEEKLYTMAKKNTAKLLPKMVRFVGGEIYMLTNEYGIFGATVMLYDDVLADIAENFESDLYILPTSIHEVFFMPVHGIRPDEVRDHLAETIANIVEKSEVLSYNVYLYDKKTASLSIV